MGYKALDYKKGGSPFKISGPCKAAAKRKFDVYPSAYANAWGVKCTKAGGPGSMGKSKKQSGGFEMTKEEQDKAKVAVIKGTRTKKEQREADRSERQAARKVKRYTRVGERRKKSDKQGAGQVGLDRYREKLQNKAKRKRRRKARREKVSNFGRRVVSGIKGRMTARRNRRKLNSQSGSGCQGSGCGAYE